MSFLRTANADSMGGVPCICGLRIPVATVVGIVTDGMTDSEILEAYPDLEAGDIRDREFRMRVDAPDRRRPFVDVNS